MFAEGLSGVKTGKTSRTIRRITQALGQVREFDVALALLDELATRDDISRPALQEVRLHVATARERRREEMLARLAKVDLDKLDRRLKRLALASAEDQQGAWLETLASRLLLRSKRLATSLGETGQLYAPDQLHRVRIDAKKLRYALELAAESGVGAARPLVAAAKKVQTTLGTLHDLQVLQACVAEVQVLKVADATAPHEGLAAIAGHIEEQCRLLHGRYIKLAPKLLDVVTQVRTDVVPALAASRPLKMSLARATRAARVMS